MSTTTCSVKISTIRSAPFSIPWGSSVYANVIATNVVCNSLASLEGNGVFILTNPDAPTLLVKNTDGPSATAIALYWTLGVCQRWNFCHWPQYHLRLRNRYSVGKFFVNELSIGLVVVHVELIFVIFRLAVKS